MIPAQQSTTHHHAAACDTRAEIRRVALELFSSVGYHATSLREISDRLGVSKAALYYHFTTKEDIGRSLLTDLADAVDDLLAWMADQPVDDRFRREVIERWGDLLADQERELIVLLQRERSMVEGLRIGGSSLADRLWRLLAAIDPPQAELTDRLRVRLAFLSVPTCILAAYDEGADFAQACRVAGQVAAAVLPDAYRHGSAAPGEPGAAE
ncbi:TetR/AcrR family transcriptional regulator [Acrocarpospora catenulata]|uniref:TetR/AcrR family transcriptional regulator n=1 Tax=Acrocarpospora catenulata TaxID=2836182 RepID=UPI001BDAE036|nr:TetR/AcrR family transcriptional regulator [Acrocarpospora catenulata]